MKSTNLLMLVVLSAAIVTALTATTGASLGTAVYADKKHCEDNKDNNCNHTEKNQKLTGKDECDNNNKIRHHSNDNNIDNILVCSVDAVNLKDTVLVNSSIFGDTIQPQFP
ncbi:MAG TPA: hypothetical protein VL854_11465 [Nitrososphaeraceae archaeon]|nr:hypothetical protein [Nitrososphaeraceae archaeon]